VTRSRSLSRTATLVCNARGEGIRRYRMPAVASARVTAVRFARRTSAGDVLTVTVARTRRWRVVIIDPGNIAVAAEWSASPTGAMAEPDQATNRPQPSLRRYRLERSTSDRARYQTPEKPEREHRALLSSQESAGSRQTV